MDNQTNELKVSPQAHYIGGSNGLNGNHIGDSSGSNNGYNCDKNRDSIESKRDKTTDVSLKNIDNYTTLKNENSASNSPVGLNGDFYTSVSVSKFFGAAIARFILRMLEENRLSMPLLVVEIGSNNGDLIADVAEFLKAFNGVVFNDISFCVLEPLQGLQEVQQNTFSSRITNRFYKELHIFNNFAEMSRLNENVFFISNELFDSMPCDLVKSGEMLYYDSSNFLWDKLDNKVVQFIESYDVKTAEIPLSWEHFIADLSKNIRTKWIFLTFDYGDFSARELNLRMFLEHKVYNFLEELNENHISRFFCNSDITYDVDFSLLERLFTHYGASVIFCQTQSKTLLETCEILEIFDSFSHSFSPTQLLKQKAKLQGLIMPNAMGERFKALCVGRL
ncbi:hypothetical protein DCO58_10605 [Helicobacter saguini]|uniref:SAM-dependent methyltransferase n=2 Tax=Helicobacter saguini TaxID=1548018 RepID=A0A347W7F6_9HELI|nr:hypothetical protein [Helicobacter saguini]MWV68083.1 hypothetical protein [Helicobacter saguini]MWV70453.1 hypothetical protein [Helicobacter saguini]MWV72354.1 hypothetical protein [Helicobacter saguini]TLD93021.1 hypothetical protein LS64_009430 [Helicobacter saguini]